MAISVYHCANDGIDFTGGLTAQQKFLLTGQPVELLEEGTDFGEGFCPNCGRSCKSTAKAYEVAKPGNDPNQKAHDAINARVLDPEDDLTADDAQAALLEKVGGGK
jgi:hypothetical protein